MYDQLNGQSKRVGFIRYDHRHEAENAVSKFNGVIPDGFQEPILVKFASYPGEIKDQIEQPSLDYDMNMARLTSASNNIK